ncbi:Tyrosine-protein phosphatase RLPH2 (Protein RHIZOBIALE-LIKE PHOSPHATASE 2), partial [Durusdinium trenchii]
MEALAALTALGSSRRVHFVVELGDFVVTEDDQQGTTGRRTAESVEFRLKLANGLKLPSDTESLEHLIVENWEGLEWTERLERGSPFICSIEQKTSGFLKAMLDWWDKVKGDQRFAFQPFYGLAEALEPTTPWTGVPAASDVGTIGLLIRPCVSPPTETGTQDDSEPTVGDKALVPFLDSVPRLPTKYAGSRVMEISSARADDAMTLASVLFEDLCDSSGPIVVATNAWSVDHLFLAFSSLSSLQLLAGQKLCVEVDPILWYGHMWFKVSMFPVEDHQKQDENQGNANHDNLSTGVVKWRMNTGRTRPQGSMRALANIMYEGQVVDMTCLGAKPIAMGLVDFREALNYFLTRNGHGLDQGAWLTTHTSYKSLNHKQFNLKFDVRPILEHQASQSAVERGGSSDETRELVDGRMNSEISDQLERFFAAPRRTWVTCKTATDLYSMCNMLAQRTSGMKRGASLEILQLNPSIQNTKLLLKILDAPTIYHSEGLGSGRRSGQRHSTKVSSRSTPSALGKWFWHLSNDAEQSDGDEVVVDISTVGLASFVTAMQAICHAQRLFSLPATLAISCESTRVFHDVSGIPIKGLVVQLVSRRRRGEMFAASRTWRFSRVNGPLCFVGDLHGHVGKLERLWERLPAAVGGDEAFAQLNVVFLGDYVDKGPDPRGTVDWLLELRHRFPQQRHVFLSGNHDFALSAFLGLLPGPVGDLSATWREHPEAVLPDEAMYDGPHHETMHLQGRTYASQPFSVFESKSTFDSYGVDYADRQALLKAMPPAHKEFFRDLDYIAELRSSVGDVVAVHAGLEEQADGGLPDAVSLLRARDPQLFQLPFIESFCGRANVERMPLAMVPRIPRKRGPQPPPLFLVSGHHGFVRVNGRRIIVDMCSGRADQDLAAFILLRDGPSGGSHNPLSNEQGLQMKIVTSASPTSSSQVE